MLVKIRLPQSGAVGWLFRSRRALVSSLGWLRLAGVAATGMSLCAMSAQAPIKHFDPRFSRLAAFFKFYNCPKPHRIAEYLHASDTYKLDYRLLPAIALRETTCGVTERHNNHWGYHPGRAVFPSVENGIDYVARQLGQNSPYAGKSIAEKLFTYNPLPAYPKEVLRIMHQIE